MENAALFLNFVSILYESLVRTEMQILLSMFITQTHHGILMLQLQTSCDF